MSFKRKPFPSARRQGRIIGQDDADDPDIKMGGSGPTTTESVVKRPAAKSKKGSSSKLSFGLGGPAANDDAPAAEVFVPRKSNLSRQAQEANALKRSGLSAPQSGPSLADRGDEDRPSYSKEYLTELKNLTPSASSRQLSPDPGTDSDQVLDVAAKFGSDIARYGGREGNSAIPTEAEIQEKKARRARLAKESKYKPQGSDSSDDSDDEDLPDQRRDSDDEFVNQRDVISFSNEPKGPATRLTHDDEDMMEDFDSFVDDGRIKLGRKAEREFQKRQREEMRDLIAEAEGSSTDSSNDSDRQRRGEYEAAQTRKGMEGLQVRDPKGADESGPRTPPKLTPIPTLSSCLQSLRASLQELEVSKKETMNRIAEVESRRQEIPAQEEDIQQRLKEAGEQYERLRAEAALNGNGAASGSAVPTTHVEFLGQRGLESLADGAQRHETNHTT